ncbi:MAG: histidine phosphatase family protein [Tagaea sp. CACIAM 22H2]|nr:histidine phosphatase family protein [Tagaea sp. CACIAM 22H2]
MMRKVLFTRHGNTFAPGEKAVWVGSRSDLPLVAKGLDQARLFGEAVRAAGLSVGPLRAGPLKRTRDYLREAFDAAPEIDDRLAEIDYGKWEGRTTDDVAAEVGAEMVEAWNKRGVWPRLQGWKPDLDKLEANIGEVIADLAALTETTIPVVCTSQGILKFVAKRDAEFHARGLSQADGKGLAVATGSCCGVSIEGGRVRVDFWNEAPAPARLKAWAES